MSHSLLCDILFPIACKCTGPQKHGIRIPPERPSLTCAQDSTPETKTKREQTGKYNGIKKAIIVIYQETKHMETL